MVFNRDDDDLLKPVGKSDHADYGTESLVESVRDLAQRKGFWVGVGVVVVLGWLAASDALGGSVVLFILFLLYFLPAVIARKKPNASSVFVINLFFGWTLIGWVIALAMAVANPNPPVAVHQPRSTPSIAPAERVCPFCAEDIRRAAVVCKHCGRDLPLRNSPTC